MTIRSHPFLTVLLALGCALPLSAAEAPKPLKALLITGGCCHDYAKQKDILKKGIEERANVIVDHSYSEDKSIRPPLAIFGNPDYAKGYDIVIHDECASDIKDLAVIEGVLKPHRDGMPGVNLHCAMHSFRGTKNPFWFEYLGLESSGHGGQTPITVTHTDKTHPATLGLADWTTINEELYNNVKVHDTAQPLATGRQMETKKQKGPDGVETVTEKEIQAVVTWANIYRGKTRVFSTTLGHNTKTVEDPRYLDLVTRGLLWACDKLDEKGAPKAGYGPAAK